MVHEEEYGPRLSLVQAAAMAGMCFLCDFRILTADGKIAGRPFALLSHTKHHFWSGQMHNVIAG